MQQAWLRGDRRAARGCPRLRWHGWKGSWYAAHCLTAGRTGTWALLRGHGWSWQQPARRAIARADAAVELRKKDMRPRVKTQRRPAVPGWSLRTKPVSR
nr:winged helix-turn-helix domain-containing protein [Streptomyces sp. SAI-127]